MNLVHALTGQAQGFTDLGKGPEGITPSELASKVMKEILTGAVSAVANAAKGVGNAAAGVGKEAGKQVEKVTESFGGLFKKK